MLWRLVTAWRDQGTSRPAHLGDQRPNPRPEHAVTLPDLWPSCSHACSLLPVSLLLAQRRQRRGWEGGAMATPRLGPPSEFCYSRAQPRRDTKQPFGHFISIVTHRRDFQVSVNGEITCLDCCLPLSFYLKVLELGGHGCSLGSTLLSPPPLLPPPPPGLSSPGA